ncbi:unnamed protein product [Spirodela intermedia]|uniref:Uncharacterized protein n=1 Tax=Spirodela intermedia TaxID=51605 RepID=A0A7I8JAY9_SPIIN|nr:unnamed protein product [Spirodela intermedia]CAA6667378.1 unnamed protein product [Spirodela intermedia]
MVVNGYIPRRSFGPQCSAEEELLSVVSTPAASRYLLQIEARVFALGLHQHHLIAARLLALCCRRRSSPPSADLNHARLLFRQVSLPSICVWNAFLRVLSGGGALPEETLAAFVLMKRAWIKPDRFTFPSLLKACGALPGWPLAGGAVHGEILRTGVKGDLHVHSSLIDMYSKNGSLESAVKLFDGRSDRDVVTWNSMVACFFRRQEVAKGRELFEKMPERNAVSWNTVITGYAQNGRALEALELFRRMQLQGWRPSEATLVGVLSACAQAGALDVGKWIHHYIDISSIGMDLKLSNSLIDMYAKGGSLGNARKLFDAMRDRSVVSWNCMIGGLALHGHGEEAIRLFGEMERGGVCPDEITFVGLLSACAHAGLAEEGRSYFNIMEKEHGIVPKVEHYGCMIDILGLIKMMPVAPDAGVWGALLSACRRHGRLDLAEDALVHLLELEPWNAGNHVLLSNMLAARGCWSEVERVRLRMKASYIGKTPGSSSIEIDRSVWEFVAGDRSHPRSEEIYATSKELGVLLKLAAHAPERESVLHHVCMEDDEHLLDRGQTHYGYD